jgi:hypothetical protein
MIHIGGAVGPIRTALDRRLLVAEGLQEGERKLLGVERLLGQRRNRFLQSQRRSNSYSSFRGSARHFPRPVANTLALAPIAGLSWTIWNGAGKRAHDLRLPVATNITIAAKRRQDVLMAEIL